MSYVPRYVAEFAAAAAAAAVVGALHARRKRLADLPEAAVDADTEAAAHWVDGGLAAVRDLVEAYRARLAGRAPAPVVAELDRVAAAAAVDPLADTESAAPAGQNT